MMARWFAIPLWRRVVGGLLVGLAIGLLAPAAAPWIAPVGDIFVRLIRMLVAPIVLVTIAAGITALGDVRRLGSIGGKAVLMFAATTAIAVAVGMAVALIVQPGLGAGLGGAVPKPLGVPRTVTEQLVGIVPANIFEALADGDMLALIFTAILIGIGTMLAGEAGKPLAGLLQSASAVLLRIVALVMEVTPFGVLALIANAVAISGTGVFVHVGWLALCVLIGSAVQALIVHSLIVKLLARMPVRRFYRGIVDALAIAFSTASSSATLPVAMRVAEENLGLPKPVASTVLPLGASIGKDGTAMYVGLLSLFSLQALGVATGPGVLVTVFLTGALAAFGTAPMPSASLFMLAAVLAAIGVGAEQTALIVGFVLPFDRLLDMTRTVPSASANLAVTATVARWATPPPAAAPQPPDRPTPAG
ncbi:dicarboxylate/amino acid:cation symporter [Sphingomonas naphthae]|uniref:Dicarboxylate/amino acid:cation symporter n=1 Tax=Sphingomonas naphthae TaxID=1813468 RepID=A0ABY7TRP3_9SPHN|nr:dicarboxylate/amino acid:cation symporter [Sphingomonas naphthae]WCT75327.1 dicarboxylate/amino acid:cation symporter [Sphingomonas naphthae]